MGSYEIAIRNLTGQIKRDKKNARAKFQLGLVYYNRGMMEKAREFFEKSCADASDLKLGCQELGLVYSITDPDKAIEYYKKILSRKHISEETGKGAIRAYTIFAASRKKRRKKFDNRYLEISISIIDIIRLSRTGRNISSELDILGGDVFLMKGDIKKAADFYQRVGMRPENPGGIDGKIQVSVARGLIQLYRGNKEQAQLFFRNAAIMLKRQQKLGPEVILPRQEMLLFCNHVLFKRRLLYFYLKKLMEEREKTKKRGMVSFENSDRIRQLLLKMAKDQMDGRYDKSLKAGEELISLVDKSGGYFVDVALLHPLFKSCVLIYMGDVSLERGKKKDAQKYYYRAIQNQSELKALVEKRLIKMEMDAKS